MGDTSGVWVASPYRGHSPGSASEQSTRSAKCEDCAREWTAICVDVPVSIFIQDLDDYYRRLSNHLLELNVPPLVMCIFQPNKATGSPESATLSYVAPQQKSGFKWRINHKGLGHKANSGCQIIPCTDDYLNSGGQKSNAERVTINLDDEVQIKQEVDALELKEERFYHSLEQEAEVHSVSRRVFELEEDSSMDFHEEEERDPLSVDVASTSSRDTPGNKESLMSEASSESRLSGSSPLNTHGSGIQVSVSQRIGEIIPASEVNREAISEANKNVIAVPSTSKSQSGISDSSGSSNHQIMKTQENRSELNESPVEENQERKRENEINFLTKMNSNEPKEIQLTSEVSMKEIKNSEENDSTGDKSEKTWWEKLSMMGPYGNNSNTIGNNSNTFGQQSAAQNLLNELQKKQLQENQRNNGAGSMHMNQFQFPMNWQFGYPGLNFFDEKRIKSEVEEIDQTQNNFQNNFFPNHDIFNLPMFFQNSLSQSQKYTGEKHFECTICNKKYVSKQNLKAHMSSHSGEKLFECPICGKRFTWKASLRTHMLGHSSDKPFHCPICNKGYNQKINLKAHMYTHTGEKPYKCPMCDQCFTQDGILKNHLLTHGDKTFVCPICSKRFYQKGGLKSHLQTHSKHGEAMGFPDHLLFQNGDSNSSPSMSSSMFGESSHSIYQQLLSQFSAQNKDDNQQAQDNSFDNNQLSSQAVNPFSLLSQIGANNSENDNPFTPLQHVSKSNSENKNPFSLLPQVNENNSENENSLSLLHQTSENNSENNDPLSLLPQVSETNPESDNQICSFPQLSETSPESDNQICSFPQVNETNSENENQICSFPQASENNDENTQLDEDKNHVTNDPLQ